jgi:hypothetical protein
VETVRKPAESVAAGQVHAKTRKRGQENLTAEFAKNPNNGKTKRWRYFCWVERATPPVWAGNLPAELPLMILRRLLLVNVSIVAERLPKIARHTVPGNTSERLCVQTGRLKLYGCL